VSEGALTIELPATELSYVLPVDVCEGALTVELVGKEFANVLTFPVSKRQGSFAVNGLKGHRLQSSGGPAEDLKTPLASGDGC
jgi:hypothetical protein